MSAVLVADELGKRYGRRWALSECSLTVPAGRVVGLVGPNGAGKTTLLQLAAGLLRPTAGTIEVLGGPPADGPARLARVGVVAQDTPTYPGLTVTDHLRMGAWMNPGWDQSLAERRVGSSRLETRQRAGRLSGGQRAQLALTLAIAKRPELLLLDEPVASLDPLARVEFLTGLVELVEELEVSVVLSSHLVSDLEQVCDHLIVLVGSRVQVAGDLETLTAAHRRLTGPRTNPSPMVPGVEVIETVHTGAHTSLLVRGPEEASRTAPPPSSTPPGWSSAPVGLEEVLLAYMRRAREHEARDAHDGEVAS